MTEELLLHPHTKTYVAQYLGRPSHAVMLVGGNGVGKTYLAETLAADVLGITQKALPQYPYFKHITAEKDKDSISIDAIRELQRFLQLKTVGKRPLRRMVIVEHADQLTTEAQNAYLKLLEEPPADTVMILTVTNQRTLLPTILSRVQSITVYAPEEVAVKDYFAGLGKDSASVSQAFFLSGGLPGLMQALLDGDADHPLMQGVTTAKEVLQKQTFERLALVEGLSKQKETAGYVVEALQRIAQTGIEQSAMKADTVRLKRWQRILQAAANARIALSQGANAKLTLSALMLEL